MSKVLLVNATMYNILNAGKRIKDGKVLDLKVVLIASKGMPIEGTWALCVEEEEALKYKADLKSKLEEDRKRWYAENGLAR